MSSLAGHEVPKFAFVVAFYVQWSFTLSGKCRSVVVNHAMKMSFC
jgi:hypothetical protein